MPVTTLARKLSGKYVFVTDDDGHDYMIPAEWREEFNHLCFEVQDGWELPEWGKFEDSRIDNLQNWVFENPEPYKVDHWAV